MIYAITVTNHLGESLQIDLRSPEKSGLFVDKIEGLGPCTATINSTDLASMDGSLFNSARIGSRNIVLTLGMMWAPTIEDSRQKTYQYFPVKKRIKLEFETDNRTVYAYGYVESNTPVIFSQQETTQISVICPDPFFYATDGIGTAFSGAVPAFSFPFSNDSLTDKQILIGTIRLDSRAIIRYSGDVDTGVLIIIHATGDVTGITLSNASTHESLSINTGKIETITGTAFGAADDILISTKKGNKYVQLLRNGVYTNIINALGKNPDWFQLAAGDNIFAYSATTGAENLMITFQYTNAFGGI